MPFLIVQIFVLLLMAALFGAWLAYWWVKRHYEDVTSAFDTLQEARAPSPIPEGLLTRTDFETGLSRFNTTAMEERIGHVEHLISNIHVPETDFSSIESRLMSLESTLRTPDDRIDIVGSRLSSIEGSVNALHNTDTARLEHQLDVLANAVAERGETDLTSVEVRILELEEAVRAIDIPQPDTVDLGPIHSGLTRIEMALSNQEAPVLDMSATEASLANVHSRLSEYSEVNGSDRQIIYDRLNAVSNSLDIVSQSIDRLHNTDTSHMERQLDGLDNRLSSLHMPEPNLSPIDEGLKSLHERLTGLEAYTSDTSRRLSGMGDLQARLDQIQSETQRLEQMQSEIMRLERIEGTIGALRMDVRESVTDTAPLEHKMDTMRSDLNTQLPVDLSALQSGLYAVERQLDLASMENRLTSIEYGLAAVHHMLRARDEDFAERREEASEQGFKQAAPPPPVFTDNGNGRIEYDVPPPRTDSNPVPPAYRAPPPPTPDPRDYQRDYQQRDYQQRDYQRYERYEREEPTPSKVDAIKDVRKPDDRANLLTRPAFGTPDDLEEISGVGPMLHGLLTEIGVYYFWQVAEWGPAEIEWVDDMLDGFNGRIERDDWVGQAKVLATGANAARRP